MKMGWFKVALLLIGGLLLSQADLYCDDGNHSSCAGDCATTFASTQANVVRHCLEWCKAECATTRRRLQGETTSPTAASQCLTSQVITLEERVQALESRKCECDLPVTPGTPTTMLGYISTPLGFWDANTACMASGYSKGLVKIDSQWKNDAVMAFINDNEVSGPPWIGGYEHDGDNNNWRWIDGERIGWTNWADNEPNNGTERCAHIYITGAAGKWNDSTCTNDWTAVCEGTEEDRARVGKPPSSYVIIQEDLMWKDANNACVARGYWGLANAKSADINTRLLALVDKEGVTKNPWIGGFDHSGSNGDWKWNDGTAFDFTQWYTGEPNGSSEQCAHLYYEHSGNWNDATCTNKYPFFCEGSPDTTYSPKWGVLKEALTHSDAQNACRAAGYSRGLAKISSAEINDALHALAVQSGLELTTFWFGAYEHSGSNDDWRWMDGSLVDYDNWRTGEPNGTTERCGMMYRDGDAPKTWNDSLCTNLYPALCMG